MKALIVGRVECCLTLLHPSHRMDGQRGAEIRSTATRKPAGRIVFELELPPGRMKSFSSYKEFLAIRRMKVDQEDRDQSPLQRYISGVSSGNEVVTREACAFYT